MTTSPRISVTMPCFNAGDHLETALTSVLSQLGPGDEVVVQDACSTDGSAAVFARVGEGDPRLSVVSERDDGQSDALNRALGRATGEFVLWLNADDIVVDGGIDAVRAAIDADPSVDLVVGAHQMLRENGDVIDVYPGRAVSVDAILRRGCTAFSGSILMRTALLREVGGFDDALNTVMDLELQLRLARHSPRQVVVDHPVGALRFHDSSKSATLWPQFVRESHRVRMAHSDTLAARVRTVGLTGLHIAYAVTFRIQLTDTYRRLRRIVRRESR
ncbi:glycosyltransferase [uncultured Williamsia sp.]|uniref:glycosyltransferase n=1 Tax=uncultured Williamsia sp. TaxID=259311 RepID=UPI002604AB1E|nr:glycosyltransferase [uncultured Williamsia sp.]